jgi:hypothetical protein
MTTPWAPAGVVQTPRTCRDCSTAVVDKRIYCDLHRDLRRVATFLHQARLIVETSEELDVVLGGPIREVIAATEGLR